MIKENSVVSMTYVLRDKNRIILDASVGKPFVFMQGRGNIIAGLDKSLVGLKTGDRKVIEISPENAYGAYNPGLRINFPKDQFGNQPIQLGRQVQMNGPDGQQFLAVIVAVQENDVVLDANHPLAGQYLFFDIDILDVREATSEEITEGHAKEPV